ncbi:MAG: PocR ligand-binding domain-containing protein [Deltaproteobacteria bacterium]|jgi:ligand-binding sensor protein|nr:PocR ligand-binding domain-containing protein [Deltaproteobacteria bacterium]
MGNAPFTGETPGKPAWFSPGITDLPSFKRLSGILDNFAKASGMSVFVMDDLPSRVSSRFGANGFCARMSEAEGYGAVCSRIHAIGLAEAASLKGNFSYVCPLGIFETAIPVFRDGRCAGGVFCCQARCDNPPQGTVGLTAGCCPGAPAERPGDAVSEAFFDSVPVIDFRRYDSFVSILSDVIASFTKNEYECQKNRFCCMEASPLSKTGADYSNNPSCSPVNLFFILNVINSISNLSVLRDSPQIGRLSLLASKYVSCLIRNLGRTFWRLDDERESICRYLEIQKIKYEDDLSFEVNLPEGLEDYLIPVDTALPFVENTIMQVLSKCSFRLNIAVSFRMSGEHVLVEFADNVQRPELPPVEIYRNPCYSNSEIKVVENRMAMSKARMARIFGEHAGITLDSAGAGGSRGLIRFPAVSRETYAQERQR